MSNICVIGAGVSGLTAAVELQKRQHKVTIFADRDWETTTSSTAAAFWYPFWTGAEPDHSWYRPEWAWRTFLALEELVDSSKAGVTYAELFEYFDDQMTDKEVNSVVSSMWWQSFPRLRFRRLVERDVRDISYPEIEGGGFRGGACFRTIVVNMSCYLPFLEAIFRGGGGERVLSFVQSSDLAKICKDFDFVVNCSGLGSRELVADSRMKPKEGVVVRIEPPPEIKSIILLHTGPVFSEFPVYIVPRGGETPDVVLGGTLTDREDSTPRHFPWSALPLEDVRVQNVANDIIERCARMEPTIAHAEKLEIAVGYRPVREPAIRLEPGTEVPGRLIHNYGHGGGGVTLSWGCAMDVAHWIQAMQDG